MAERGAKGPGGRGRGGKQEERVRLGMPSTGVAEGSIGAGNQKWYPGDGGPA